MTRARRVVHVSQLIGPEHVWWQGILLRLAVCDDGTMWERFGEGEWFEVSPVPQPAPAPASADAQRIAELERERDNFEQMAREFSDNADYYRRLVVQIGETCGSDAYVSDDGSVQQDVLCAKVPELVVAMKRERDEAHGKLDAIAAAFGNAAILDGCATLAGKAALAMREGKRLHIENIKLRNELDEARRALEELKAAPSQGEGQQERLAAVAPSPASAEDTQGSPPAPVAPSPAPIPLGAVVEVYGDKGIEQWEYVGNPGDLWRFKEGVPNTVDDTLTTLYHATHPVATRETVERVAKMWYDADILRGGCDSWAEVDEQTRDYYRTCAKMHARSYGVEVAE